MRLGAEDVGREARPFRPDPGEPQSVLKNNSLAEVKFEQIELGNPSFGCALSPIDFVAFARACGADGYRCERPEEIRPAIQAALRSPRAALVEAIVDADEKPVDPEELRV
jgi:pyruvate dehydrogenase (quinone)/pyruvate decarboxylase